MKSCIIWKKNTILHLWCRMLFRSLIWYVSANQNVCLWNFHKTKLHLYFLYVFVWCNNLISPAYILFSNGKLFPVGCMMRFAIYNPFSVWSCWFNYRIFAFASSQLLQKTEYEIVKMPTWRILWCRSINFQQNIEQRHRQ